MKELTELGLDGDLSEVSAALERADLPISDLSEPGRRFFALSDDDGLIGYAGVEGNGADRLLRSVLVLDHRRAQGAGRALLDAVEAKVFNAGVERLHLLTTTAEGFFERAGYKNADRAAAPPAISASREFTSLCPASAAYMIKTLS